VVEPEVPVTVTVYAPNGAAVVVFTVNVEVIVPFAAGVTDAGAKLHVTAALEGEMAHVNATAELKLFTDVTVIVAVVELPTFVVADTGVALRLKSGADPTFKLYVVVRFWPFPVPVTVTVYAPVGVEVVVFTVNVEVIVPLATGVTEAGESEQVTVALVGDMEQDKATAELKLLIDVTVIVEVVELPAAVVADTGDADKLKSLTVNV
jgi:hypothetical protein